MWEGKPPNTILVLQVEISGGLECANHMFNESCDKSALTIMLHSVMATYTISLPCIPLPLMSGMHDVHKGKPTDLAGVPNGAPNEPEVSNPSLGAVGSTQHYNLGGGAHTSKKFSNMWPDSLLVVNIGDKHDTCASCE